MILWTGENEADPLNPRPCHGRDFELQAVEMQRFPSGWNVLKPLQQETRKGVMLSLIHI